MDFKDIANKPVGELHKTLHELREKSRDLRFKNASGQLKKVRDIRLAKKDAARVLTALNTKDRK